MVWVFHPACYDTPEDSLLQKAAGVALSLFSRARSQQLIPSPSASSAALPSADLDPFPENRPAAGMERVFVTKVAKQEGQGDACYWLRVQNLGSGALRLTIVDKTEAQSWTAELTDESAKGVCKLYGLAADDYWKIILEELENTSGNYTYTIRDGRFRIEKISSSQIKFAYADLPIESAPYAESMAGLLETLMESHTSLKKDTKNLKNSLDNVTQDREVLQETLQKFTDESVIKEETLLTNFLALLNAKKKEIKRLQENGKAESEVSRESDYDADTDVDEEDKNIPETPPRASNNSTASTSREKRAKQTESTEDDVMDL